MDIDASTYIDAGVPDAGFDAGIVDPGIISAQMGDTFQAEPTVAAGPNGMRVSAWLNMPQSIGRYQIAYAVSQDDGQTFGKPRLAEVPDGGWWARSPVAATGPDSIWLAWPAIHLAGQTRDDVRIMASRFAFGATEPDSAITIDDGTKLVRYGPSIAVLDSKSLIVAYTEQAVTIARIDTNGSITRATLNELGIPSLCTDGQRVYAVMETDMGVVLHWSDDEGRTWPDANVHAFEPDPDLAGVQPRCAASGDSVWVVYGATSSTATSGQEMLDAVLVSRSKDRAATWAGEVDVKPPAYLYAMLPNIAAAGDEAYLAFYVGAQADDPDGGTVVARVGDQLEGSTVARAPIKFQTARVPPSWQGDALGVSVYQGHLDVVYADDTSTASHVGLFGIEAAAVGQ
jgi:hypothetical protein